MRKIRYKSDFLRANKLSASSGKSFIFPIMEVEVFVMAHFSKKVMPKLLKKLKLTTFKSLLRNTQPGH